MNSIMYPFVILRTKKSRNYNTGTGSQSGEQTNQKVNDRRTCTY